MCTLMYVDEYDKIHRLMLFSTMWCWGPYCDAVFQMQSILYLMYLDDYVKPYGLVMLLSLWCWRYPWWCCIPQIQNVRVWLILPKWPLSEKLWCLKLFTIFLERHRNSIAPWIWTKRKAWYWHHLWHHLDWYHLCFSFDLWPEFWG